MLLRHPYVFRACNRSWSRKVALRRVQCQGQSKQSASTTAVRSSSMPSVWSHVLERYNEAQAQHASSSIETNTELLDSQDGVTFVLKIAAALRDKPKPAAPSGEKKEWRNPFLPYEEALWVQHLSPTHTLLLNKFNVVPHHLLVVTRQFEAQLDPLNAADMEATWAVMQSMPNGGLAFYNCGPDSGASQPHKHVQLVPLPLEGSQPASLSPVASSPDPGPPIWPAIAPSLQGAAPGQLVDLTALPFAAFGVALPPPGAVTPQFLADAFARLLARCREFVAAQQEGQQGSGDGGGGAGSSAQGEPLSYNMLLTQRFLLLVPRRQEADGPVSCNSVAFAGSFFTRSREEVEHVRGRGPMQVLAAVGYPWPQQAAAAGR